MASAKKYEVQRQEPGSTEFCARENDYRNKLHRHGIGSRQQLQLSGPGEGCEGEPEEVCGNGERDNSFTNNQSSEIAITKRSRGGRIQNGRDGSQDAGGTLAVVYTPAGHTDCRALNNFSNRVTARWDDPNANTFTGISGSPFPNTRTQNFTTPGNNKRG